MAHKKKKNSVLPFENMDVRLIISNPYIITRLARCNIYTLAQARKVSISGIRAILRRADFGTDAIEDTINRIFRIDYSHTIRCSPSGYPLMPLDPPHNDVR